MVVACAAAGRECYMDTDNSAADKRPLPLGLIIGGIVFFVILLVVFVVLFAPVVNGPEYSMW